MCFNIFFYKKIHIKYLLLYFFLIIIFILILVLIFYVFIIKIQINHFNTILNLLIPYTLIIAKLSQNIFNYLILIGL